jgi:hypothetical protein
MKRLFVLLMAVGLLVSCKSKKNENGTGNREKDDYLGADSKEKEDKEDKEKTTDFASSGWSSSDIRKYNELCDESFKDKGEIGKYMCGCLLEKFQKMYSSYAEMDRSTSYDEGKKLGTECRKEWEAKGNSNSGISSGNGWPQSERDGFINSCVTNAMKKGQTRSISQSYCDCMLNKMESLYPDINDAARLSEDEVDRIIARYKDGCLEEN